MQVPGEITKMVRTQIQLTGKQTRGLKAKARRENTSMAELIRRAVDTSLLDEPPSVEAWARALAAAGSFHSGLTDFSTEHDKYLAEAHSR
jgi:hypothetical protein